MKSRRKQLNTKMGYDQPELLMYDDVSATYAIRGHVIYYTQDDLIVGQPLLDWQKMKEEEECSVQLEE